ncbi:hypothetical protein DMENIID0001_006350 [Sergentomyia squamirostris]
MSVTEGASTSGGGSTNQHSDEWIRPNNKRKGTSPGLNNRMTKQSKITNWLGVPTTNRFGDLPVDDNPSSMVNDDNTGDSSTGRDQPRQPPPPPIFVHNVEQIQPLYTLLDEMAPNGYILKPFVNNQVKIQLKTIDLYRSVLKALQEKGTQLHSYQIKSERTFRVVLRNLHHSTDLTELKKQLAEKGHTVVNIHNVKHRISKQPLPIFYVNLTPNSNNNHTPVLLSIMSAARQNGSSQSLYNSRTDWELFRRELNSRISLTISIKTEQDLESASEGFSEALGASVVRATPQNEDVKRTDVLPQNVRAKILERRRLRRRWQATRSPDDKSLFNKASEELKSLLKEVRNESVQRNQQNKPAAGVLELQRLKFVETPSYRCQYCFQKYFITMKKKKVHEKSCFNLENMLDEFAMNSVGKYVCTTCSTIYPDLESLGRHKSKQHDFSYTCSVCSDPFKYHKDLIEHMRYHVYCMECKIEFVSYERQQEHIKKCHLVKLKRKKPVKKVQFLQYKIVDDSRHIQMYQTDKNNTVTFDCPLCKGVFPNSEDRRAHVLLHFICEKCGKTFEKPLEKRKHTETCGIVPKVPESPVQKSNDKNTCKTCTISFPTQGYLNLHIRTKHLNKNVELL